MERISTQRTPLITHFLLDPGSAITHFIGMVFAIAGVFPMLYKATMKTHAKGVLSVTVFCLTLFLLYFASTTFHSFITTPAIHRRLQKFDHMMIYVLIAGTYTPICLISLSPSIGIPLLIAIWSIAMIGVISCGIWISTPKWLNSTIYIVMGWFIILAVKPLVAVVTFHGFAWLLAGGIIYTVGGIVYAIKLPLFNERHQYFGTHEIFHLFVMAGSLCHFLFIYQYVL